VARGSVFTEQNPKAQGAGRPCVRRTARVRRRIGNGILSTVPSLDVIWNTACFRGSTFTTGETTMQMPHVLRIAAVTVALSACASAGGGLFPEAGDPGAAIPNAERLIAEAQTAGAEQYAAEALTSARGNLAAARAEQAGHHNDRAALKARMAVADAEFAKAASERAKAEKMRADAQASLAALPGGGR
jgi:hypothetical protein